LSLFYLLFRQCQPNPFPFRPLPAEKAEQYRHCPAEGKSGYALVTGGENTPDSMLLVETAKETISPQGTVTLESARFMSPHLNVYSVSYRSGAAEFKAIPKPAKR
jgi:hypothetical protein